MPALPNVMWEHFAKDIVLGKTQRDAYKSNGGKSKFPDSAASRLANSPKVAARIKELTARATERELSQAVKRTGITKEYILEQLLDTYNAARAAGAFAPANRSLELMGKEHGMFRDLEPIKAPRLEDLPTEDIERMLAQSIADNPPTDPDNQAPPPITQ